MADFQNKNSVAVAARTNGNRDVISQASYLRWLAQGKLFEAGFGPEDTAADSQAALDDTLVTFALQSNGASKIVVPILFKAMMVADGGALTRIDVAFTKPAALCATALTLTGGRAMTSIHNMYQTSPAQTGPTASALYGAATTFAITASALVAGDYVDSHRETWIDAALTVMTQRQTMVFNFLAEGVPHGMTAGAAMLVYINTGTTDSTWLPYVQWAELDLEDLV